MGNEKKIKIAKNGPYLVSGSVPLDERSIKDCGEGELLCWHRSDDLDQNETYALCRCGRSRKKPYCDGAHDTIEYDGTESADHRPFCEQAKKFKGPELTMWDVSGLCASAHFCTRAGGTWDLVEKSDDPEAKKTAIQEVADCPSGRLVLFDSLSGETIEPDLGQSISVVRDETTGKEGPLWIKGGITIESSDGRVYEKRNRVTLCRCGRSRNKPFCDSSHAKERIKQS
jgi:CDGSH-type Zn-finger protein